MNDKKTNRNKNSEPKRHRTTGPKCNICAGPGYRQEYDNTTGQMKNVFYDCVGHYGLLPYVWNRHPDYDKFYKSVRKS